MPISVYIRALREKIGTELLLVPAVTALIYNERDEVLLQRAKDDGEWHTIGGAIDPGENPADALVREVFEETGLRVVPMRIVGVYSDPEVVYPNGDRVMYVSTTFVCRIIGDAGEGSSANPDPPLPTDDESLEFRYFPLSSLPHLLPGQRHRIAQALKNEEKAYFEWNEKKT
jgi:8-oxo-dGTP diphosphatase